MAPCPCSTDSGSNLDHGGDLGISQSLDNSLGVVAGSQSAGGAVSDTLTTEDTVGVLQITVQADVDGGTAAGTGDVPNVHALDLVTDLDTTHALDALGGIGTMGTSMLRFLRSSFC